MKRYYFLSAIFAMLLLLSAGACANNIKSDKNAEIVTGTVSPTAFVVPTEKVAATPTVASDSTIPQDPILDAACRRTIAEYFNAPTGDVQKLENLIMPSKYYLLDSRVNVTNTLLQLTSANEWWHEHFPGKDMDGYMKPGSPNEYVYFVEYAIDDENTPVLIVPSRLKCSCGW